MIRISGFEAKGLAADIVKYLEFCEIDIGEDIRQDLINLIRFHGGLKWDDIKKCWRHPDTGERLVFNVLTLRCEVPESEAANAS